MAIIGYARVSKDQNLDLQIDALNKAEGTKIFTTKICQTLGIDSKATLY